MYALYGKMPYNAYILVNALLSAKRPNKKLRQAMESYRTRVVSR